MSDLSVPPNDPGSARARTWTQSSVHEVDGIPLGTNFSKVLHEEVAKCGVLLAMIGPNWPDARDEHGNRRLDDPNDFVRIEARQQFNATSQ